MRQVIDSTIAPQSFRTVLLVLPGALACVLAGIGVLGVASYSVALRTREIGDRMALGARGGDISSLLVAAAAIFLPVRRAIGTDPVGSLRHE